MDSPATGLRGHNDLPQVWKTRKLKQENPTRRRAEECAAPPPGRAQCVAALAVPVAKFPVQLVFQCRRIVPKTRLCGPCCSWPRWPGFFWPRRRTTPSWRVRARWRSYVRPSRRGAGCPGDLGWKGGGTGSPSSVHLPAGDSDRSLPLMGSGFLGLSCRQRRGQTKYTPHPLPARPLTSFSAQRSP